MANTLLTPDVIVPKALDKFINNCNMLSMTDRQLDSTFEAKVGDTVRVRRLTRFQAVSGADITGNIRSITEGSVPVVLDQYKSVPVEITSTEMTLELKDFTEQVIEPAMIELVQQVESDIAEQSKYVWNQVGTPGTTPSTINDAMLPKQALDLAGVPDDRKRSAFYEPIAATNMAAVLGGVFPTSIAELAITEGEIRRYAGFVFLQNQSLIRHTVGTYVDTTAAVDGANQDVTYDSVKDDYKQNLVVKGFGAANTLNEGDRFTIAGVFAVNPKTRRSTGQLQQFVVRADATLNGAGAGTLSISPAIIDSGAFQTVDAAPADSAAITVISGASGGQYAQNMAFHKNAITVAFANIAMPMGGAKAARQSDQGVSIRVVMDFDIKTDTNIIRFDVLYAVKAQNPGMAVVHVGQ